MAGIGQGGGFRKLIPLGTRPKNDVSTKRQVLTAVRVTEHRRRKIAGEWLGGKHIEKVGGSVIVMSTHCLIRKRFSCWQIRLKEAGKSKDPTIYVDICVLSIFNPDGIFFLYRQFFSISKL